MIKSIPGCSLLYELSFSQVEGISPCSTPIRRSNSGRYFSRSLLFNVFLKIFKNKDLMQKIVIFIFILIVFLGCPKQEKFIASNKEKYCVPVSITMGGCVDFIAGGVKRAPQWMQERGLEWFYRFIQEPKRLFKRYFLDDIRIFWLVKKYHVSNRSGSSK